MDLDFSLETYALHTPFRIARGTKTHAEVIEVRLTDGERTGCGEGVPYARFGETPSSAKAELESLRQDLQWLSRSAIHAGLPMLQHRSVANALTSAWLALHPNERGALLQHDVDEGARTLVVGPPRDMAAATHQHQPRHWKVKLQGDAHDLERIAAVSAATKIPLWLDANEGWSAIDAERRIQQLEANQIALLEQPVPADADSILGTVDTPIALCADESIRNLNDLEKKHACYDVINIKLDKAGGFYAAVQLARRAHNLGLQIAVGCMVSSQLSIAAGWHLVDRLRAQGLPVPYVDLDGATFLAHDRDLAGTGWSADK